MLIMLLSWKRFSQRICHIQVRVYFANLYVSFPDILPYHMEASKYVLGSGVGPRFLSIRNRPCVVAIDVDGVLHARKHFEFDDELP